MTLLSASLVGLFCISRIIIYGTHTPLKHFYFFLAEVKKFVCSLQKSSRTKAYLKSPGGGRGGMTGCSLHTPPAPEDSCMLGPPYLFPSKDNIISSEQYNIIHSRMK